MLVIRSSRLFVSSANAGKRSLYVRFIDEYRRVLELAVDELWTWDRVPPYVNGRTFPREIETWLGAIPFQLALKQASGIVRGTRTSARHLGKVPSKPRVSDVCPELSQNMVSVDWKTETSFDGYMTISSVGRRGSKIKIIIPLKRTSHFNKLDSKGALRKSYRLSKKGVSFAFEIPVEERSTGNTLGIDVGISDVWSDSRGNRSVDVSDVHGHTLSSIMKRLSRRKKDSKGFKRTQSHRDNFIGWSVNRLNFDGISEIKIEDIKHMRMGRKCDRFRSHWTYPAIFRRLEQRAEERGVRVTRVDPRNTSRTCSACGVVDGESRRGKRFVCVACGHTQDADLNAALNISRVGENVRRRRGVYSPLDKKKSRVNSLKEDKT